jgi:hypothetical protein
LICFGNHKFDFSSNESINTRLEQIEEATNANYQALNEGFKDLSSHALLAIETAERNTNN